MPITGRPKWTAEQHRNFSNTMKRKRAAAKKAQQAEGTKALAAIDAVQPLVSGLGLLEDVQKLNARLQKATVAELIELQKHSAKLQLFQSLSELVNVAQAVTKMAIGQSGTLVDKDA